MSKSYDKFLKESIDTEATNLINEAMLDADKMDILEMFLDEEVANTASAPGLAMVSDGEPVSPKYKVKEFGKGIWRRKKKKADDLMEATKVAKPKKSTDETTGHLPHVGELLYSSNPHSAIKHVAKVHDRFRGKHSPDHKTSLKVDGGMSVVLGRHQDGRHFVSYKKGSQQFENHGEIAATGKEHYVREMSPLLDHAKRMNLKPGHAFQADIVHNTKEHSETTKPNATTYKVPKGKHLVLAAHSQYSVGHGGELKKTTSHPDVKQLEDGNIHAPDLSLGKHVDLSIGKERSKKIGEHLKAAKGHMTKETTKFAKDLASGKGGHHSKFKAFIDQYNSHAARTSGQRSVEGARKYVSDFMAKKSQSSSSEKSQKALHDSLHKSLSDHEQHFHNLFNAHNHINAAKHHILDEFKGHAHKFDIHTRGGEEHEGIVSTIGEKHQAKLVREGPGGFPEKNEKNQKTRFAKPVQEEATMKLSLDIHNTNLMETHYVIHGVETITVDDVISLIPVEELEMLAEGAKRKIVIRGGKKRIVFKCPEGQKLAKRGGKACIKMGGAEKAKRSRQAKKSARKSKKKRAAANRKRAKSLKKRKSMVR